MNARVSVIIPTIGRPEIGRAIRSVRDQRGPFDVEIVVVDDSADGRAADDLDADLKLWTGGRRGGGLARNLGVTASTGSLVGFLDDDDAWSPRKLLDQMRVIGTAADPRLLVVSGRHVHVSEGSGRVSRPGPDRLVTSGQSVEDYLFLRRKPAVGRASMYTSTLLCSRSLAERVPWREDLRRHQDWDWLVRLGQEDGVIFAHAPEVVARIQTGSSRSISATSDWRASLCWADATLSDPAVFVDFVVGQTLRYALTARSAEGVRAVAQAVRVRRARPSVGPLLLGATGFLPRQRFESLMTRHRPRMGPSVADEPDSSKKRTRAKP